MTDASAQIERPRHRRQEAKMGRNEKIPPSPKIIEEYLLINRGFLPRADLIIPEGGTPAWTLDSIAAMLGVTRSTLIERLQEAGTRFDDVERSDLT
ncbi:MAG: hypothetical protein RLZ25_233 [Pseudomonadota bacterium]